MYLPRGSVVICLGWLFAWLNSSGVWVFVAVVFVASGIISSRVKSVSTVRAANFFVFMYYSSFPFLWELVFFAFLKTLSFGFIYCYFNILL
jgi:hypothetical protein